jgi:hypothetical protein
MKVYDGNGGNTIFSTLAVQCMELNDELHSLASVSQGKGSHYLLDRRLCGPSIVGLNIAGKQKFLP